MGKNLKICFISGVISRSGGTERVGILIANELAERGYDVTILSFWDRGVPFFQYSDKIRVAGLLNPVSEGKLFRTYIYPIIKLHQFIKKNQFDIVIDIDTLLSQYTAIARLGTNAKLISWEHFNYFHTKDDKKRNLALKLAARYADKIVLLTKQDYMLHAEKAGIPEEKLVQIYNPTPFEGCRISPRKEKNVIAVGRLTDQKGFDLLLNAWALIEHLLPDWSLIIVGSGENERLLKEQASFNDLKKVKFMPSTNKIEDWYDRASAYVLSSRYEGFPMVLLEAMSKGLPIVSFDCVTGPSEIVIHGNTGYLVEDGSEIDLADKMLYLLSNSDLLDEFSENSLTIIKDYHIKPIVDKWENLIMSLMRTGGNNDEFI